MVTGVEIGLGIKALKTAFDIAKEAKDLTDTTAMRSKIIDMQSLIMEAQASAIDAREDHAAQVEKIRGLEAQVANFEAWDDEKARYEMNTPWTGATVYALKKSESRGEPPHWLCANCYQNRKKSILSVMGFAPGPPYGEYFWLCPSCGAKIRINHEIAPQ
jgi:hypothetical protein